MGLLDKLKSLLGSGSERSSPSTSGDPDVTVEREPSAASEHAVKGTDAGTTPSDAGDGPEPASTTAGTEDVDIGAETEPEPEAGTETTEPEPEAETETTEPEAESGTDAETATEPETDAETATEPETDAESPSVEEIKGIGPTYAGRLEAAGIETVADLAAADAETVAEAAESSVSRAEDWIERARADT